MKESRSLVIIFSGILIFLAGFFIGYSSTSKIPPSKSSADEIDKSGNDSVQNIPEQQGGKPLILVIGCADGRCTEMPLNSQARYLYIRSIAGATPNELTSIISDAEVKYGTIDFIVTGTHDSGLATGGCGGQALCRKLQAGEVIPETDDMAALGKWVEKFVKDPDPVVQSDVDGLAVQKATNGRIAVAKTVFNTSTQKYEIREIWDPVKQNWVSDLGIASDRVKSIGNAFKNDGEALSRSMQSIAGTRGYSTGQNFPEVVINGTLRPVEEVMPSLNQGERFVVTAVRGIDPSDTNAQASYAFAHAKEGTKMRFIFETEEELARYLSDLETNKSFMKWAANGSMKGDAIAEIWQGEKLLKRVTLRPAGIGVGSLLWRGISGALFIAPMINLNKYQKLGDTIALPLGDIKAGLPDDLKNKSEVLQLGLSPFVREIRAVDSEDPMGIWSIFINRTKLGKKPDNICFARSLTDPYYGLLLSFEENDTPLLVCPNQYPVTTDLKGASIVYFVPGTNQEPVFISFDGINWKKTSGPDTLYYDTIIQNKARIKIKARFRVSFDKDLKNPNTLKEVHRGESIECTSSPSDSTSYSIPLCSQNFQSQPCWFTFANDSHDGNREKTIINTLYDLGYGGENRFEEIKNQIININSPVTIYRNAKSCLNQSLTSIDYPVIKP